MNYLKDKYRLQVILLTSILGILWSCANVGNPEGGPYDMTPPKLVSAFPAPGDTGVRSRNLVLKFNEFSKLTNQQEKLVIYPAFKTPARITASGKSVHIRLEDSLRPNTTYSFYFDDAIVDNNEDNPIEDFSYTFSSGSTLDSMQISGVVLDAQTQEPIPNVIVGAHLATSVTDSILRTVPFVYISKTNKLGKFTIRGLKDSTYTVFALNDNDNNHLYNLAAEGIAFSREIVRTTKLDSIRIDTIRIDSIVRRDTLYRDSLVTYRHTYYEPSQVVLKYFINEPKRYALLKHERVDSVLCKIEFATPLDSLPKITVLDYTTEPQDSLIYTSAIDRTLECWLRKAQLIKEDSIRISINYAKTDSLGILGDQTDTLTFYRPKIKQPVIARGNERTTSPFFLDIKTTQGIFAQTPTDSLYIITSQPVDSLPISAIQLEIANDSIFTPNTPQIHQHSVNRRRFDLHFPRIYGQRYRLHIDSATILSIYRHNNDSTAYQGHIAPEAEFGTLELKLIGADSLLKVELLDKSGSPLLSLPTVSLTSHDSIQTEVAVDTMLSKILTADKVDQEPKIGMKPNRSVTINSLKPNDYYIRAYVDLDKSGTWTTGDYPSKEPEAMYYSPNMYTIKKGFTTSEIWDLNATPLVHQKPEALRKQKPEVKRRREDKNTEYYKRIQQKKNKGR